MIVVDADQESSAANSPVSVTYAATSGVAHVIAGLAWSYSGTPTTGRLTITVGTASPIATVFDIDIRAAGPDSIVFFVPLRFAVGQQVTITLAAGASGVTGRLNVLGHWTE